MKQHHDHSDHTHAHHHHNHGGHGHSHAHAPESFNKAFAISVFLNFGFVIFEAVYAIFANSMGLLADAGHNLGDVLGLMMAWAASWLLTKGATDKYSYGYKKTTILASLANALLLVATSAIIAYESINKLLHPEPVNEMTVIYIAAIGIIINGGTALLFLRGRKDDLNIKGAFLHLAGDALIALGVVVAGVLMLYTGWEWLDPLVGLLIVLAILAGTWGLLRDSVNLIMDAVPYGLDVAAVRHYLTSVEGVEAVHDLHIWGLSTKENALTAHLVMPNRTLTDDDHQQINLSLKEQFNINHVTIQVEKGNHADPCGQVKTCES